MIATTPKIDPRRLGAALQQARESAGLTQDQMAEILRRARGTDTPKNKSSISMIESGAANVLGIDVAAWCRACGVNPDQVYSESEEVQKK